MISDVITWLLGGDVSIQYRVYRDLFGEDRRDLQANFTREGLRKVRKYEQINRW